MTRIKAAQKTLTRNYDIVANIILAMVHLWFGYVEDRDPVLLTRIHD